MPGVNAPADQYLMNIIRQMQQQISALQRQAAFGVTDSNGQLRHFTGAQWVDETGSIVPPNQDGAVPSDTYGMAVFDANGNLVVLMGEMADGKYGMEIYDSAGNPRTRLGQLPDGDYGTAIYSQANDGTYVELNVPAASPVVAGPLTTISTSFTPLAGSPTLAVTVGASGQMLVVLSGTISISGSTSSSPAAGFGYLYCDGVATDVGLANSLSTNTGSMGSQEQQSAVGLLTGLSQGAHTLSVEYKSGYGQSVSFEAMQITAIPY